MNIFQIRDEAKRLITEIQNITESSISNEGMKDQVVDLDQKIQALRSVIQTIHNQSYMEEKDPILEESRSLVNKVSNVLYPNNLISNLFSFVKPESESEKTLLAHVELLKEEYNPSHTLKSWMNSLKDLVKNGEQKKAFDLLESTVFDSNQKMELYVWAAIEKGEDGVIKYVMENFSPDQKALFLQRLREASPQDALIKSLIHHLVPFSKVIQEFVGNKTLSSMILDVIGETKVKECSRSGSTLTIRMTEKSSRELDSAFIKDFIVNTLLRNETLIKKAIIQGFLMTTFTRMPRIEIPEIIEIDLLENRQENKALLEFPDPSRAIGIENLPGSLGNLLLLNAIYPKNRAQEAVTINLSAVNHNAVTWDEDVLHTVQFGFGILDTLSKARGAFFQ